MINEFMSASLPCAKVNIKMLESGQNNNVGKPTFLFCPY